MDVLRVERSVPLRTRRTNTTVYENVWFSLSEHGVAILSNNNGGIAYGRVCTVRTPNYNANYHLTVEVYVEDPNDHNRFVLETWRVTFQKETR